VTEKPRPDESGPEGAAQSLPSKSPIPSRSSPVSPHDGTLVVREVKATLPKSAGVASLPFPS
jgi:hypothetical protein